VPVPIIREASQNGHSVELIISLFFFKLNFRLNLKIRVDFSYCAPQRCHLGPRERSGGVVHEGSIISLVETRRGPREPMHTPRFGA